MKQACKEHGLRHATAYEQTSKKEINGMLLWPGADSLGLLIPLPIACKASIEARSREGKAKGIEEARRHVSKHACKGM